MSQFEKFKAKILSKEVPKDITPNELQIFLRKYGFDLQSVRGSHYIYKHPDLKVNLTIPMHKPVKPVYIDLLKEKINELEGKNEKL